MKQGSDRKAPFQLKGSSFSMMVLKLIDPDDETLFPSLTEKLRLAPNFFQNAPVVIDLDQLPPGKSVDMASLVRNLREVKLQPVGVVGGSGDLQQAAMTAGLTVVPTPPRGQRPVEPVEPVEPLESVESVEPAPAAEAKAPRVVEVPARPALIVDEPVRSGRQIYAPRSDLIVLAPVSAGAELLADGNIHIYGSLRGRALAGMNGDVHARIFCSSLEAQLVSIAGLYRVSDDIDPAMNKKPVQIFLEGERMRFAPLS